MRGKREELGSIDVDEDELRDAKYKSNNATTYARNLLRIVFTEDAIMACTLAGGTYYAGGAEKRTCKPRLNSNAVKIITGK